MPIAMRQSTISGRGKCWGGAVGHLMPLALSTMTLLSLVSSLGWAGSSPQPQGAPAAATPHLHNLGAVCLQMADVTRPRAHVLRKAWWLHRVLGSDLDLG